MNGWGGKAIYWMALNIYAACKACTISGFLEQGVATCKALEESGEVCHV